MRQNTKNNDPQNLNVDSLRNDLHDARKTAEREWKAKEAALSRAAELEAKNASLEKKLEAWKKAKIQN